MCIKNGQKGIQFLFSSRSCEPHSFIALLLLPYVVDLRSKQRAKTLHARAISGEDQLREARQSGARCWSMKNQIYTWLVLIP